MLFIIYLYILYMDIINLLSIPPTFLQHNLLAPDTFSSFSLLSLPLSSQLAHDISISPRGGAPNTSK